MAQFDSAALEHLKKLCRTECDESENQVLLKNFNDILDYMAQLNEVDTTDVEPCNYVLKSMLNNLMREDTVQDVLPRERFLNNAPDQIGGMVRVPPVLKDL